ncbi:hypothetical protein ABE17_14040 [Bacillus mycoides]|uniref:HTH-like domain-containing protein n=1 Tax=Bacillus mycoides TaxID=1405 RepID=A0ABC9R4G6_BACMY|nr:hypothetical protein III_02408 [Bacillus mycoides]MBG9598001.1 hypothetical protein [Bacillus mycoides]
MNHKRVCRLMRELGVQSIIRKKRPFYGRKTSVVFKNHLNREFQAEKQNQKYVMDITYVRNGEQFTYLSALLPSCIMFCFPRNITLYCVCVEVAMVIQKRVTRLATLHIETCICLFQ